MDPIEWVVLVTLLVRVANGNEGEMRVWGSTNYSSLAVCKSGLDIDKSRIVERFTYMLNQGEEPAEILRVEADCIADNRV